MNPSMTPPKPAPIQINPWPPVETDRPAAPLCVAEAAVAVEVEVPVPVVAAEAEVTPEGKWPAEIEYATLLL